MKNNCFIFLFIAFLFSCQKTELEFSCDPVINAFVSENRKELSQITVSELTSYEPELQKAIFNSWDYRKKRSVWIEKLRFILVNENLTKAENHHIQNLVNHIEKDYFLDENIQHNIEARSEFAISWINYGIEKLEWAEQYVVFIVYRLYTSHFQFESELSMLKSLDTVAVTNTEDSCDCNVFADFCGYIRCVSGGCSTRSSNCGWLWSMPCDGVCY